MGRNTLRHLVCALVAMTATGCLAMTEPAPDFRRGGPQTDMRQALGLKPAEAQACRIYVVEKPSEGAKRIGSIEVPENLAADKRLDDVSRDYACDLRANEAVKEDEHFNKYGKKYWRMGIYGPK